MANQHFLSRVVEGHVDVAELSPGVSDQMRQLLDTPESDIDKVRSTLLTCMRDWSAEGAAERESCYAPLVAALQAELPVSASEKPPRVLVPGAGAGRLALEVALRGMPHMHKYGISLHLCAVGYECQGNEFSYYMLLASNYILNQYSIALFSTPC